jgi:hypothetical protein
MLSITNRSCQKNARNFSETIPRVKSDDPVLFLKTRFDLKSHKGQSLQVAVSVGMIQTRPRWTMSRKQKRESILERNILHVSGSCTLRILCGYDHDDLEFWAIFVIDSSFSCLAP